MASFNSFGSLTARKNALRLLIVVVSLHLIFNFLLPARPAQQDSTTTVTPSAHEHTLGTDDLPQDDVSDLTGAQEPEDGRPDDETWADWANSWGNALNPIKEKTPEEVEQGQEGKKLLDFAKDKDQDVAKDMDEAISKEETKSTTKISDTKTSDKSFFRKAIDIFVKNKPEGIDKLELNDKAPSYYYIDIPNPTFTIEFLSQFLKISDEQLKELKAKHDQLKLDILDFKYPDDVFEGKGMVMIGGGSFMGTALTSIRALRETGSKLPLQLMLTNKEEYDADVCEKLLPKLNAKCMVMEEIVGSEVFKALDLQKYELKVLGLFLSTFEEVLLLDADNLAVKDPDYILESKPYKEFGYVIWPDFWRQTISPYFYDIAGVEIGEAIRKDGVPPEETNRARAESQLSDLQGAIPDSTCEAGQLAINKKLHHKSLMATVYYNLNGFKYYYWLLGQGAVGIGDKDTFIAGLTVFKESYYFVKQRPLLYGYDHSGGWQDTTMVQFDPEQDYEYYGAARNYLIEKGIDSRTNLFLNFVYTNDLRDEIDKSIGKPKPDVQFLHIHSPKFNALNNYQGGDYEIDGHERRQFGDREKIKNALPLDWELKISRISQWLACDSEIIPENWKQVERSEICNRIKKHVDWLIETSDTPEMANLKDIGV